MVLPPAQQEDKDSMVRGGTGGSQEPLGSAHLTQDTLAGPGEMGQGELLWVCWVKVLGRAGQGWGKQGLPWDAAVGLQHRWNQSKERDEP